MAHDVSQTIISKVSLVSSGPEHDEAVRTGAIYWRLVLDGKDATAAKAAHDAAMSRLMGCSARIDGRKLGWKERLSRVFNDTTTTRY